MGAIVAIKWLKPLWFESKEGRLKFYTTITLGNSTASLTPALSFLCKEVTIQQGVPVAALPSDLWTATPPTQQSLNTSYLQDSTSKSHWSLSYVNSYPVAPALGL